MIFINTFLSKSLDTQSITWLIINKTKHNYNQQHKNPNNTTGKLLT